MYRKNNCDEKRKEETALRGKRKAKSLTKRKTLFSTSKIVREKRYLLYNTWKYKKK
jgi:hypothetical protein